MLVHYLFSAGARRCFLYSVYCRRDKISVQTSRLPVSVLISSRPWVRHQPPSSQRFSSWLTCTRSRTPKIPSSPPALFTFFSRIMRAILMVCYRLIAIMLLSFVYLSNYHARTHSECTSQNVKSIFCMTQALCIFNNARM